MTDAVRRHFVGQARACRKLGSPFTARLLGLAAERIDQRSAVGRRILSWPGDPNADALALRFAGALHALVLAERSEPLARVWHPRHVDPETFWRGVAAAVETETEAILATLESPPQTNEVSRSSCVLAGLLVVARETGLPIALSEIGASAGLNLLCDRWRYLTGSWRWGAVDADLALAPDWTGPPPPEAPLRIVERRGCDRNPLDPSDADDRLRLRSYIWADQNERRARLDAALAVAASAELRVDQADAAEWLIDRLGSATCDGVAHTVFHTIVWQYLPETTRSRIEAALENTGRRASAARPLAWLRLEADGEEPGAGLRLTLWPGGRTRLLARGDFHGRWIESQI